MAEGQGISITFMGEPRVGKGTLLKKILADNPNKEHIICATDNDFGEPIFYFYEFNQWLDKALNARDAVIILDEAGSFLKPNRSQALPKIIAIQTAAPKRNNLFIKVFHSWYNLGEWLLVNEDGIVRWNTGDGTLEPYITRYKEKPALVYSLKNYPKLEKYQKVWIPLR